MKIGVSLLASLCVALSRSSMAWILLSNNDGTSTLSTMASAATANYVLRRLRNSTGEVVPLPSRGNSDQIYEFTLAVTDGDRFFFEIGNILRTTLNVTITTDSDSTSAASFGDILSTRLMPPPPVRPIEDLVVDILESTTKVIERQDGDRLRIIGDAGKMTFVQQ